MTSQIGRHTGPTEASYDQMMSMITGFWVTQTVRAAATFSVADHLINGVSTADAIASAESIDPDATRRLLRTCASLGLVTSDDGVHFAATDLLLTLLTDVPGSLKGFAVSQSAPGHWLPWGRFPESVRTGQRQTLSAHGAEIWEYFAEHSEEAKNFTTSMDNLSTMVIGDAVRLIDTTGVKRVVDIGGASGTLVHALMAQNPNLSGAVLDLPGVVPDAITMAKQKGLAERFDGISGDFFESVPPADLHLLKFILHDWDDDACVRILRNCRTSLDDGGRVVVVEMVVGELGEPGIAPMMDMNMLAMTSGRERDIGEYDKLFASAGLARTAAESTQSPFTIIEATAVA
jgi:hypothetical protein